MITWREKISRWVWGSETMLRYILVRLDWVRRCIFQSPAWLSSENCGNGDLVNFEISTGNTHLNNSKIPLQPPESAPRNCSSTLLNWTCSALCFVTVYFPSIAPFPPDPMNAYFLFQDRNSQCDKKHRRRVWEKCHWERKGRRCKYLEWEL